MAFDRFKGQAQQAAGSVQSAVGDMTGDEGMQAEGLAREVGGRAQDLYGAAKGQVEDAADIASGAASDIYRNSGDYAQRGADAVTTTVRQYPLSALLLAAAVGFLAALLVASRN